MGTRTRVCIVVAVPMTIEVFLLAHLKALQQSYDVTVAVNCPENCPDRQFLKKLGLDIEIVHIPIARALSPFQDLACLAALFKLFRSERFSIVHSITPKAGLLCMLASSLAGVPIRIHTFTGQVWVGMSGWKQKAFKFLDRVLASAATKILADSPSQLDFLHKQGIVARNTGEVLGKGSISGVDTKRFLPRPLDRHQIRFSLGIPDSATVFGFIGRIKKDKGVLDLVKAFRMASLDRQSVHLIVVGPDEENLKQTMIDLANEAAGKMSFVGWTSKPELYMPAFDMLCLPSYREGFGSVIIEAAACGVPALASRIYGISDAVLEGDTGILHDCGDIQAIAAGMKYATEKKHELTAMGQRARTRACSDFDSAVLTGQLVAYYKRTLAGDRSA